MISVFHFILAQTITCNLYFWSDIGLKVWELLNLYFLHTLDVLCCEGCRVCRECLKDKVCVYKDLLKMWFLKNVQK